MTVIWKCKGLNRKTFKEAFEEIYFQESQISIPLMLFMQLELNVLTRYLVRNLFHTKCCKKDASFQ